MTIPSTCTLDSTHYWFIGRWRAIGVPVLVASLALMGGCATTGTDPSDPWEESNRDFYEFNDTLDRNFLAPVARQYLKLPGGMRRSMGNFLDNFQYPTTIINQFLQGKFERGMEDTMRLAINTTFGIGGLFDIASAMDLPANSEDFGQTLAVWGAKEGNYVNYPLLGPSTVRDTPGLVVDRFSDPSTYFSFVVSLPLAVVSLIDTRARLDGAIRVRDETALDPYVFTREGFRQQRRNLIYDGDPPLEDFEDLDDEELDEEFEELEREELRLEEEGEPTTQ